MASSTSSSSNVPPKFGDFVRPGVAPRPPWEPVKSAGDTTVEYSKSTDTASASSVSSSAATASEEAEKNLPPPSETETNAQQDATRYSKIDDLLTPIKDYRKFLSEQNITEEEAARIVDDLVTKGYYEETVQVTRQTVVTLRTRIQNDALRVQNILQMQRPLFESGLNEIIGRYNLAASLASYKEKKFDFPAEKNLSDNTIVENLFRKRLDFVEALPEQVFLRLQNKLSLFDRKIAAVFREGVVENF